MRAVFLGLIVALAAGTAQSQGRLSPEGDPIARAKYLELDTPYVPPPGDSLEHHTAGFAKVTCSAVYMTRLAPEFAAENVGYFTSPYLERMKVGKPIIDRINQVVHVTLAKLAGHDLSESLRHRPRDHRHRLDTLASYGSCHRTKAAAFH